MFIANNHKMHINNKLNYFIKLKFIFLENKKRTIIVPLMEYKQSSSVKSSDRRNSIYSDIASKKEDKKSIFFSCLLILSGCIINSVGEQKSSILFYLIKKT